MSFNEEEIKAFTTEAQDLLDTAEKSLLLLDKGESLESHYDAVFRAFHSIKGAAGMMNLSALQNHMHQLETIFTDQKTQKTLDKPLVDLFLRGLDATRSLLEGKEINFDYNVAKSNPTKAAAPEPPKVENTKSLGKILVVDDEPDIVDLVTTILTAENITVRGLTSSEKVLAEIAEFKPDVLFSDIAMPEINGLDLLALVKKAYPDLPVVFISGYVNKEILLQAIHFGVYAVIEKPFDVLRVAECGIGAIEKSKLSKMLNSSINLLMYQFSDLSDFLKSQGKNDIHKVISDEIASLLEQRRILRQRSKAKVT